MTNGGAAPVSVAGARVIVAKVIGLSLTADARQEHHYLLLCVSFIIIIGLIYVN